MKYIATIILCLLVFSGCENRSAVFSAKAAGVPIPDAQAAVMFMDSVVVRHLDTFFIVTVWCDKYAGRFVVPEGDVRQEDSL